MATSPIDEELGALERDIRQLKIEYDQYFGGGRKRPPEGIEWRIDLVIKRYAERGGELRSSQRFRYNNLVQTYAKYKDIFRKRMQRKEESTVQRHFGAAARAIEAERQKKQPAAELAVFRMSCSDPEREGDKIKQLYEAFLEAKRHAGEDTAKLSRPNFNAFVRKKTGELQKQQNCREVEYVVEVVEGQVKLKALVKG